jgi:hypothetical protein
MLIVIANAGLMGNCRRCKVNGKIVESDVKVICKSSFTIDLDNIAEHDSFMALVHILV